MQDPKIFKNFLITRRQFVLGTMQLSLVGTLIARLAYLQLFKYNQYLLRSTKNSTSIIFIAPIRGEIIDYRGAKLAINIQQFNLLLHQTRSKSAQESLNKVCKLLKLSINEQNNIIKKIKKLRVAIIIKNLSWNQVVLIEQNMFDLKHIAIDYSLIRFYPYEKCMSHIIGYASLGYDKSYKTTLIGKSGVEKIYDKQLEGIFGERKIEVDAYGNKIRELSYAPSKVGENLTLGIDLVLQNKIYDIFKLYSGCVIVFDLKDGRILSLVSTPGFASNDFAAKSISYLQWDKINQDPKLPLLNKAISSTFPPGSIFKLVTVLAALQNGLKPNTKFMCNQGGFLGSKFNCWKQEGHGLLNMEEALGVSCNHYMYNIAQNIGYDAIVNMANQLGLGQRVEIDLPGEVTGSIGSNNFLQSSLSKALNLSIGQGEIAITPLQLSRLISAVATKGKIFDYKIKSNKEPHYTNLDIPKDFFKVLHKGMWRSVNHISGTGSGAKCNYNVAGKTGTSQVFSKTNFSIEGELPWHLRNHALFGGFAPFNDPRFSVMVVIEHGQSGGKYAAPIAKQVFDLLKDFCENQ